MAHADWQTRPRLCKELPLFPCSTHTLPPLPVIPFHPVTLSYNWAPPCLRYTPGPLLLEKFLPCLLPGQIPAHTDKKELQGPLPSLEVGSPTPVTQAEAKGFSNTEVTVVAVSQFRSPGPLLLMMLRAGPGVGRGWTPRVSLDKGPSSHTHSCLTHPPVKILSPRVAGNHFSPKESTEGFLPMLGCQPLQR